MTTSPDHTFVFADDASPACDVAWLWICNHRWARWHLDVMTALTPEFPYRPDPARDRPEPWEPPHQRVAFAATELGEIRHLAARTDPRAMIDRRRDAELVVVAPHGVSHLHQLLMGSTTDWLLHYSPCPLLVVRSATPTRRVLVCDDGSDHARHAVDRLGRLPWIPDTDITVLTVDEDRATTGHDPNVTAEQFRARGAHVTVEHRQGKPTATILDEIERLEPQLVVLGTRGLTGWKRLRLGSTAGTITRVAPCSVFVAGLPDDDSR